MSKTELHALVEKAIFQRQANNAYEVASIVKRKTGERVHIPTIRKLIDEVATSYRAR